MSSDWSNVYHHHPPLCHQQLYWDDADSTLLCFAKKYFQIIEFIDTLCLPYCEIFSLYHNITPARWRHQDNICQGQTDWIILNISVRTSNCPNGKQKVDFKMLNSYQDIFPLCKFLLILYMAVWCVCYNTELILKWAQKSLLSTFTCYSSTFKDISRRPPPQVSLQNIPVWCKGVPH